METTIWQRKVSNTSQITVKVPRLLFHAYLYPSTVSDFVVLPFLYQSLFVPILFYFIFSTFYYHAFYFLWFAYYYHTVNKKICFIGFFCFLIICVHSEVGICDYLLIVSRNTSMTQSSVNEFIFNEQCIVLLLNNNYLWYAIEDIY